MMRGLLERAFEGAVPPVVDALWPGSMADRHALSFKAAPILRLGGPTRAFVSNVGEAGFVPRVASTLGDARVAPFFAQVPDHTRRMIDTDGVHHDLFLDDLQLARHTLQLDPTLQWMCDTLRLSDGRRTAISRHGTLPESLLDGAWLARARQALALGLSGLWGVRWEEGRVCSLLLVNEDRWTGSPESAATIIDGLGDPRWLACRAHARDHGLACYPDAVELHEEHVDITIGLFDPTQPACRELR